MAWQQNRRPASEYINRHKAQRILERDHGICCECGHPGATGVDHRINWAEWTRTDLSVHDQSNLAAIHDEHAPCAVCGRDCHGEKTKAEAARGRRRRADSARRPTERHPGSL